MKKLIKLVFELGRSPFPCDSLTSRLDRRDVTPTLTPPTSSLAPVTQFSTFVLFLCTSSVRHILSNKVFLIVFILLVYLFFFFFGFSFDQFSSFSLSLFSRSNHPPKLFFILFCVHIMKVEILKLS